MLWACLIVAYWSGTEARHHNTQQSDSTLFLYKLVDPLAVCNDGSQGETNIILEFIFVY